MRQELKALRLEQEVLPKDQEHNGMVLVALDEDIDAIERDGEEKAGELAARPTEYVLAAKVTKRNWREPC